MSEVVVVAIFRAKEGCAAELESAINTSILATHEEEGCVRFALHRDRRDPAALVLVERWRSMEALQEHIPKEHVAALQSRGDLMAGKPDLYVLDPRPFGDPVKGVLA